MKAKHTSIPQIGWQSLCWTLYIAWLAKQKINIRNQSVVWLRLYQRHSSSWSWVSSCWWRCTGQEEGGGRLVLPLLHQLGGSRILILSTSHRGLYAVNPGYFPVLSICLSFSSSKSSIEIKRKQFSWHCDFCGLLFISEVYFFQNKKKSAEIAVIPKENKRSWRPPRHLPSRGDVRGAQHARRRPFCAGVFLWLLDTHPLTPLRLLDKEE